MLFAPSLPVLAASVFLIGFCAPRSAWRGTRS
jgi:hypothetical protein